MILCEVVERNESVERFRVKGHALYEDFGKDVVCSAVSILVINTINSCEALLGIAPKVVDRDDELSCDIVDARSSGVQLLFRSMVFGLQDIAKNYPKHVKVRVIQAKE